MQLSLRSLVSCFLLAYLCLGAPVISSAAKEPEKAEVLEQLQKELLKFFPTKVDGLEILAQSQVGDATDLTWKYKFEAVLSYQNGAFAPVSASHGVSYSSPYADAKVLMMTIKPGTNIVVGGVFLMQYQSGQWLYDIRYDENFPAHNFLELVDLTKSSTPTIGVSAGVFTAELDDMIHRSQTETADLTQKKDLLEQQQQQLSAFADRSDELAKALSNMAMYPPQKTVKDPESGYYQSVVDREAYLQKLHEFLDQQHQLRADSCVFRKNVSKGGQGNDGYPEKAGVNAEYSEKTNSIEANFSKRHQQLSEDLEAAEAAKDANSSSHLTAKLKELEGLRQKLLSELRTKYHIPENVTTSSGCPDSQKVQENSAAELQTLTESSQNLDSDSFKNFRDNLSQMADIERNRYRDDVSPVRESILQIQRQMSDLENTRQSAEVVLKNIHEFEDKDAEFKKDTTVQSAYKAVFR